MELLILSKLQWDLSAITPYDYLDVMINSLETEEVLAPKFKSRSTAETSESVRRDTEKLVTLCATDDIFVPLKPSVLAAASLLTAIERSDLAKLVNLNEIIDSVENMANLDKVNKSWLPTQVHLFTLLFTISAPRKKLQGPDWSDIFGFDQSD